MYNTTSLSHVALHMLYNFCKEYISRFPKTPPFKNLKYGHISMIGQVIQNRKYHGKNEALGLFLTY